MAITYDKKTLKRLHKQVNGGNKKHAFKTALFFSIFWFAFMIGINYLVFYKNQEEYFFDFQNFGIWFFAAIIFFIFQYYLNLKNWKDTKALYDETIQYFKENDPTYLDDLGK